MRLLGWRRRLGGDQTRILGPGKLLRVGLGLGLGLGLEEPAARGGVQGLQQAPLLLHPLAQGGPRPALEAVPPAARREK